MYMYKYVYMYKYICYQVIIIDTDGWKLKGLISRITNKLVVFFLKKRISMKTGKNFLIIKLSARGLWNKENNENCLRGGCVHLELKC